MGYTVPAGTEHAVVGGMSEADINAQNQFMRSQPWYQQFMQSVGQDPNNVHLNDRQKDELMKVAQTNGFVIDQGDIEVDPAGNFNPKGHKLRNTLIAAGIGAASLTGLGAAGIGPMSGLFGGASGAAGAAGATGAASAAVPGSAAAQALVPSAITGLTTPGVGMAATTTGLGAAGSSGGLLSTVGGFLKNHAGDLEKIGGAVGAATDAAGKNRITEAELNMRGNAAYENQLMNRSADEQKQRNTALDNVYRASWYGNRQASPYNTRGLTPISDQFKDTLAALAEQGAGKLSHGAQYDSDTVAALKPYTPTKKGVLETIGTWASPILTTAGSFSRPKTTPPYV